MKTLYIKFAGRIGEHTGRLFTAWLVDIINKNNPNELVILFSSQGGATQSAIEMASYVHLLDCKITIIATSAVHAAGMHFFLNAAHKENRWSLPGGTFMCHKPAIHVRDLTPTRELQHKLKISRRLLAHLIETFAQRTGNSQASVRKFFAGEGTYFDTQEAEAAGIIAGVTGIKLPQGEIVHVFFENPKKVMAKASDPKPR